MSECHVSIAVSEVDPGGGTPKNAKTPAAFVGECFGVPALDGTHHGNTGVIRVRTVKRAVPDNTTVEMHQRLASFTLPACETLARLLLILPDDVIADGVQESLVSGNGLVRFLGRDAPLLVELTFLRRGGCSRCAGGRCRYRREGCTEDVASGQERGGRTSEGHNPLLRWNQVSASVTCTGDSSVPIRC